MSRSSSLLLQNKLCQLIAATAVMATHCSRPMVMDWFASYTGHDESAPLQCTHVIDAQSHLGSQEVNMSESQFLESYVYAPATVSVYDSKIIEHEQQ